MTFSISSAFDAGNIRVLNIAGQEAELEIETDHGSDFYQWFHFRVGNAAGREITLRIVNVAGSAYPLGWPDYRARVSEDRENWRQADTDFDGQTLTIRVRPETNSLWVAYFAPYSMERHYDLVTRMAAMPGVSQRELTRTLDGRPLDCLTLGEGSKQVWLYARQHPGETMAEWFVEGLVKRLAGWGDWAGDPVARKLYEHAVFYIVPNMNPDGSVHGNLRTNAAGANLNREWMEPDPERSPEVFAVRDALHSIGCDMFFDIHGDEALPYVFVAGCEMLPGFTANQAAEQAAFIEAFKLASPDFQDQHGYEAGKYQEDALKLASKYVGNAFGCLSLTLEMPFKDNANLPDERVGWNGERSAALGAAMLGAVLRHLETFR
jgi:murein tripeptide amidase MpaA